MENNNEQSKLESSLVLILQDEYSGFATEETMLITDQKRLQSFYSKLNRTRKPGLPVPIIDFTTEMVIVRCNGEQNYVGLPSLTLSKETDTEVVLMAKTQRETEDTTIQIMTNPFCVYKMALTKKEVVVEQNKK